MEKACLSSRTGRQFQRYNNGSRQVVGCIPYRFRENPLAPYASGSLLDDLEVLLVSSQKSQRMMFPKGGWETDESREEAAKRETLEEAGVLGHVEPLLGTWRFKSKSQGTFHEGYMLPLHVTDELELWPEKSVRQRLWMTVKEAREACDHWWMKEALDRLVRRLMHQQQWTEDESQRLCLLEYLMTEDQRIGIVVSQGGEEVDLCVVT